MTYRGLHFNVSLVYNCFDWCSVSSFYWRPHERMDIAQLMLDLLHIYFNRRFDWKVSKFKIFTVEPPQGWRTLYCWRPCCTESWQQGSWNGAQFSGGESQRLSSSGFSCCCPLAGFCRAAVKYVIIQFSLSTLKRRVSFLDIGLARPGSFFF